MSETVVETVTLPDGTTVERDPFGPIDADEIPTDERGPTDVETHLIRD